MVKRLVQGMCIIAIMGNVLQAAQNSGSFYGLEEIELINDLSRDYDFELLLFNQIVPEEEKTIEKSVIWLGCRVYRYTSISIQLSAMEKSLIDACKLLRLSIIQCDGSPAAVCADLGAPPINAPQYVAVNKIRFSELIAYYPYMGPVIAPCIIQ